MTQVFLLKFEISGVPLGHLTPPLPAFFRVEFGWCQIYSLKLWNRKTIRLVLKVLSHIPFTLQWLSMIRNPSIYNILRWVAWRMEQTNRRPRVPSIIFFIFFIDLGNSKLFFLYFCNFIKKIRKWIERVFAKNFARNQEKKIILGTSDAWSTIHLSHRPSDLPYYIVNWRI